MALRLRVVSEHSTRLGPRATKIFGVHGGSIGRSSDNEWILPDPERYLSGKHARVDFRAGVYVLVDTSSNGTYINGAQVPLGKYHDYQLKDGDYLRIGEYELLVSIDKSNDFPPDDSAIVAYDGKTASSAIKKSTANDLGADLDLSILLETSDQPPLPNPASQDSGIRPRDAFGQTIVQSPPAAGGEDATPWHMLTRPLKVEPQKPVDSGPPSLSNANPPSISTNRSFSGALYDSDFEAALSSFCRGAGIELRAINNEARSTALQLAGQILRETLLGLRDLHHSNHEFRNRFRINSAPAAVPESPLNLAKGVDETLVRLLNNLSTRAGSVEAVRNSFRELKAENAASLSAMHAAFEEFLQRVDPKELEERFEKAGNKRGVFGSANKAKYWELFAEMYSGLAQRPNDGFPHLYTEAFARAFEAKLATLLPPRRNGFEADRNDDRGTGAQAVGDL